MRTRDIIKKLSLGLLDELGFHSAILDLIENWHNRFKNISLSLNIEENAIKRITPEQEPHIYRIFQEALTNISKHSKAKHVKVNMIFFEKKKKIRVEIINDGVIKYEDNNDGTGLMGIAERVNQIKGKIKINKGKLFKIIIELDSL